MKTKFLAWVLLVPFTLYTAYTMVIAEQSLLSFAYQLISSPDTAQVLFDLYIMAILAIIWMYNDSKKLGLNWYWVPFSGLTLLFVSVGPLLYLVLRPTSQRSVTAMDKSKN